jgi:C1A family cysteine protease
MPGPEEADEDFFDDDFFDDDKGFDDIVADMDSEFEEAVARWDKEFEETLKRWEQGNKEYLQRKDAYQASTIAFESDGAAVQFGNSASANIAAMRPGDFHVIPNALSLEVRDQKYRGTCTAFAGVRALEILLAQHGIGSDLSEHNFYFRSKPECQNYPCNENKEGGTLDKGLRIISREGVMAESNCRYHPNMDVNNITYSNAGENVSPPDTCVGQPVARSGSLTQLNTIDQLLNSLKNNRPVVAGVMLRKDDSFNNSSGLVERYDPKNVAARSLAPGGHAITLVGYIKLPPTMSREGSYCVITTNSWDKWRWGSGGHACITEAWLKQNINGAYAVNSAILTNQGLTAFSR